MELQNRVNDIENYHKNYENKMKTKLKSTDSVIETIQNKLGNLAKDFDSSQKVQTSNIDNITGLSQRIEQVRDQCNALIMNLSFEMNNVLLKVKIESRNLEELTTDHQSILQNYRNEMK